MKNTDVLYVTRVQRERFESDSEYQNVKNAYRVTPELLSFAKEKMIVMHPLPRTTCISPEVCIIYISCIHAYIHNRQQ